MTILKLIRFPNLLMVFFTQWVIYQMMSKAHQVNSILSNFQTFDFILLSVCTMLIAASGYVINDIYDQKIDSVNKPEKQIVGKYITGKTAMLIYILLLVFGFGLAFYLAVQEAKTPLIVLFPASAFLLFLYALHFKKTYLLGNVLVSLFVAAVPIIVILGFFNSLAAANEAFPKQMIAIYIYAAFGFISNLLREIVKDLEDVEGDHLAKAKTLPIVSGSKTALSICIFLTGLLIVGIIVFICIDLKNIGALLGFLLLAIIASCLWLINHLRKAEQKGDFGRISLGIKIIMLIGLISLYIWSI